MKGDTSRWSIWWNTEEVDLRCEYNTYALDWPRATHSQFTCDDHRLAIPKRLTSIVIINVNGKLDVLDAYRAYACTLFVSLGIVCMPLYVLTALRCYGTPPKVTWAGYRRCADMHGGLAGVGTVTPIPHLPSTNCPHSARPYPLCHSDRVWLA